METPDWLNQNGGTTADEETPTAIEGAEGTAFAAADGAETEKSSAAGGSSGPSRCKSFFFLGMSLFLFLLFVYSTIVQNNDENKYQWYVFYAISAVIPAFYIIHNCCCLPAKVIYVLTACMTIWSIVHIVIYAIKLEDTPKGGSEVDQNYRRDLVFDLGGSCISFVSALYHAFLVKRSGKAQKASEE